MLFRLINIFIFYFFSWTVIAEHASYADAVEKAAPSVVCIQTSKKIPMAQHPLFQDPFFRFRMFGNPDFLGDIPEQEQQGLGSGVIVDNKGYILTNNHVVNEADSIIVKLPDDRSTKASVIGTDPQTDLAVLKIKLDKLPAIQLGQSSKLRVGDVVLAIGNPFGFERTVTQGIVSATGSLRKRHIHNESIIGTAMLDNLIQTDAAINPGNSGGALIDAHGNLIGINMAIISKTGGSHGIGFAIPIDTAKSIMTQLINTGKIVRGWLGAYLSNLTLELQQDLNFNKQGIYVQGVFKLGPAHKAGILPGDIIVKINNTAVQNSANTIQLVANLKPGKPYPIEIFRNGSYISFSVVIGSRPKDK